MSSALAGNPLVDKARQILCAEIARCMRDKRFSVRVRIAENGGQAAEVLFYSHGDHGWQKESQPITDQVLVAAMNETLEMLASKQHHDAWSARRQSHSDINDTDLQFHADKLQGHLGDTLEADLMGLLFRDQHDSKKDSRRNIRTPKPAQNRR
jgi:hypothetical protein